MNSILKLDKEAKVWLKRSDGKHEILRVFLDDGDEDTPACCYKLYTAFELQPEYIGRVLFDKYGYWIYDGDTLTISEQEQVAKFIINYTETL